MRITLVRNATLVKDGKRNRESVRSTLNRGLTELTGADSPVEAWRTFVQPGDQITSVVGDEDIEFHGRPG